MVKYTRRKFSRPLHGKQRSPTENENITEAVVQRFSVKMVFLEIL